MATDPARITTPERTAEDADAALRPKSLDEFIGQQAARENLRVFVNAAKARGEALDHVLLHGPPGLGKTTLAGILAREMGVGFRATSGPVIAKSGDLAALLTNLEDGDVLFIDEIHRLNPAVEEVLYPAMEDRALDLMIGEGPSLSDDNRRPLRRRPGRRGKPRGRPQRTARHDRGCDRAVPHPARPHRPHRARAMPQRPRLPPSRPAAAARQPGRTVRSRSSS